MKTTIKIVKKMWDNHLVRILFIASGIIVFFVIFGILEEQIMKKCYERDNDGKCVQGGKQKMGKTTSENTP